MERTKRKMRYDTMNIDLLIGYVIQGFCVGGGSSIGVYIANRGLIKHLEKLK